MMFFYYYVILSEAKNLFNRLGRSFANAQDDKNETLRKKGLPTAIGRPR